MRASLAVRFADASAASLTLALKARARPSLATVQVDAPRHRLELHVLGASHQVVVELAGTRLVEVVACDTGAPGTPLPAYAESTVHGLRHRFTARVAKLDPVDLAAEVDAIERRFGADPNALVAGFPGDRSAVTALAAAPVAGGAGWRTWHAYPQTGELVATETVVVPA